MAKQIGDNCIEGCFSNIVFYKLGENYYARMKSSLTGNRVKKDAAFKKTMEHAGRLARASTIASAIYRSMPERKKESGVFRKLTGRVMYLLKKQKTTDEIIQKLCVTKKSVHSITIKKKVSENRILFANAVIREVFSKCYLENRGCKAAPV